MPKLSTPRRELRARAPIACEIARVDRDRLNEAIAADLYPCAPPTIRGRSRTFDRFDIFALFAFGRLIDRNYAPRYAGHLACEIMRETRSMTDRFPGEQFLITVFFTKYATNVVATKLGDGRSQFQDPVLAYKMGGDVVYSFETWRIDTIMEEIQAALEEEANTLGKDEGED